MRCIVQAVINLLSATVYILYLADNGRAIYTSSIVCVQFLYTRYLELKLQQHNYYEESIQLRILAIINCN